MESHGSSAFSYRGHEKRFMRSAYLGESTKS